MKLRRVVRPVIVLLAGVTLASTVAVAPASASISRDHRFRTPFSTAGGDGAARLKGSIEWFGPHKFIVWGYVDDLCPADGWSADSSVRIYYMDGTHQNFLLGWDNDGCTSGRESVYDHFVRKRRIKKIRLSVCECDWHEVRLVERHRFRDNPYTG